MLITLLVDGTTTLVLKPGDSYQVPPGRPTMPGQERRAPRFLPCTAWKKASRWRRRRRNEIKSIVAAHTLNRREALALIGGSGAVLLTAALPAHGAAPVPAPASVLAASPSCIARPQQTEGPFFVEEELNRSDIRSDPGTGAIKPGVPLRLAFKVSRMSGASCTALAGAQVDIWHCDAAGRYSDVGNGRMTGEKFLRGYQRTDAAGMAQFVTIYPGWYGGRTVHVHFKIRAAAPSASMSSASMFEFTSQLYFDEALTDRVYASAPYAVGRRRSTRNADDFIFRDGGSKLLLELAPEAAGYAATFDVGLQIA
jgi:protocatechuate 3,4-dioxygenase beta subunit